jgi:hypothetical protein
MKYVIKTMRVFEENKDGEPLRDKHGNPFKRVFLEFGEEAVNDKLWEGTASYLDYYDDSASWNEGTELEGNIVKRDVNGKTFWNFYKIRPLDVLEERVQNLEDRMTELENKLSSSDGGADASLPF